MENEKPKRGRPPKQEVKKEIKEKYVVRSNFFYKGAQFHAGQEIGFSKALFDMGKIEKKKEEKLGFEI